MILGCAPGVHEAFHQVRLEVMEIHEPDKQVHVTVFPRSVSALASEQGSESDLNSVRTCFFPTCETSILLDYSTGMQWDNEREEPYLVLNAEIRITPPRQSDVDAWVLLLAFLD